MNDSLSSPEVNYSESDPSAEDIWRQGSACLPVVVGGYYRLLISSFSDIKKACKKQAYQFRFCTNGQRFSSSLKEVHHQIFCAVFFISKSVKVYQRFFQNKLFSSWPHGFVHESCSLHYSFIIRKITTKAQAFAKYFDYCPTLAEAILQKEVKEVGEVVDFYHANCLEQ